MEILKAHRQKQQKLKERMDTLNSLHDRLLETWLEIIAMRDATDFEGRIEKIGQFHQVTTEIAAEIIATRKAMFGSVASLSELDIFSRVDSMVVQKAAQDAAIMAASAAPAHQAG